jgi:hypothetical protein
VRASINGNLKEQWAMMGGKDRGATIKKRQIGKKKKTKDKIWSTSQKRAYLGGSKKSLERFLDSEHAIVAGRIHHPARAARLQTWLVTV